MFHQVGVKKELKTSAALVANIIPETPLHPLEIGRRKQLTLVKSVLSYNYYF